MLDSRMRSQFTSFDVLDWSASAVIVAPHPDDETLGCGGVAIKKLQLGAKLHFVFVTDGSASHPDRITAEMLRTKREAEAVEAVTRLGGTADCVTFLRIPDGSAARHVEAITHAIAPLLDRMRPGSIFVTHAEEPPSDHVAVNRAVWNALRACRRPITVYEYPIWYWYHWPWISLRADLPGLRRLKLKQTFTSIAGLRTLSALNTMAYVGDVIELKRAALNAHVSQMMSPPGEEDWPTLPKVSDGEFIARLMSSHEVFMRYEFKS
jgi:LmbE family N-acetylglucosaminyl deacetylase